MSHTVTVEEHPWPAVVLHWVHLISFLILAFTGLAIHYKPAGWPMGTIINLHYLNMFVFVCTTIVRIYWAFMGAGSANTGSTVRIRDYKHFAINRKMLSQVWPYVKYYLFISKTRPRVDKYNPLQALTYGYLFPLLIVCMAITGFGMYPPASGIFGWVPSLLGGPNNVRWLHFMLCFVMLSLWLIHLYLVVMEEPAETAPMLFHSVFGGSKTAENPAARDESARQSA